MGTWAVETLRENVHRVVFTDITAGWEAWALLRSDTHHDSPHCRREKERAHLEEARRRGAVIIDYGDLFDVMGGRFDPRKMESTTRPEHKVDGYFDAVLSDAEEFYAPYADLFAVMGPGNHETGVLKHHSINLTHALSRRLREASGRDDRALMGGYGGWVIFQFSIHKATRSNLKLRYHHGYGGNAPVTDGIIDAKRRAQLWPDADIITTGHTHKAWVHPVVQERCNDLGVVRAKTQYHICTPGYLDSYGTGAGGWGVEKGFGPGMTGACWLHFRYEASRDKRHAVTVRPVEEWGCE